MSKPISFALVICFMLVLASGNVLADGKPPLNAIRITGEVLAGGVGGVAGLLAGFRIGEGIVGRDTGLVASQRILTADV